MTARFFFVGHTIVSYIYRFVKDAWSWLQRVNGESKKARTQ
jgi:hypothetical protein